MDDALEVFVKGTDNHLYHVRQAAPSFAWGHWEGLSGILTTDPVVGQFSDGRLDVLVRGDDGKSLWHISQISPTGPGNRQWTRWAPLGGALSGKPAVAITTPGTLDVVVRGASNELRYSTTGPAAP